MMMMCEPGPSSHPRPLIENLDRFSVHELEQMRERQMKIVNRPRRVAAPPSDETERRRARQKVETIELRLIALRAEEEMSNPRDQTKDIIDQLDLMNVGKPVQVELKVKTKLSTRPYGMAANEPNSPGSPHGPPQLRPAMSEEEAIQIQREAYALATAKKEADEQRRALHAQATNTRGISEEEKRRRILAYMSYSGESDEEDDDDMDDDDDGDGDDLFGEYEDDDMDMEADEYGLGGIIRVDPSRYANFGD
ncbi:Osteopontin domain-containing protein [Rhizoctonia solani AG-1 IA]|uniref:Osteopontin domain protein n=2 Tax=Rhizoctonia solani TaxID=456999 RepID=A0A8H7IKX6_9AGAM